MSVGLMSIILIALLFLFLASGLKIAFTLAGVGIIGLHFFANRMDWIGPTLYNSVNSFILTAIPFFLFMGQIVLHSGLSSRLYKGVSQWTRIIPGGLLHSNIISCSIFAAISGSSPATAATMGMVAYPELKKRKYNSRIVLGSLAAGGTLGILIPPSINFIIYGAFVGQSIGRLFIAGIIPGIIMSFSFILIIFYLTKRNKSFAPLPEKINLLKYLWEAIIALKDIWPFLLIILVILGSIYGGIMTTTEAAAASAFLSIILGFIVGNLNLPKIKDAVFDTLKVTGMVLMLFTGANILGSAISALRIPAQVATMVGELGLSPYGVWFAIVLLYIVLGLFIETGAMMLITLPVTYPLVVNVCGFDPIWFGVQIVLLCEIGMITPPVGINIFVIQGIAPEVPQTEIIRGIIPFLMALIFGVILFTFFPQLCLFLPNYVFG